MTWQDEEWMARLRGELSFSHLLELSRVSDPLARAFYEVQTLAHRWSLRELKRQRESPPIGIVLCADKDAEEVHYATGNLEQQIFVSRYLTKLPTEQQLRAWLAEERESR